MEPSRCCLSSQVQVPCPAKVPRGDSIQIQLEKSRCFCHFFLQGSGHKASALTVSTMCCGHLASAGGSSLFPKFAKVEAHGETAAAHTAGWAETLGEAPLKALSLLPAKGRDEWTGAPWQVPTSPVNEFPERERLRFCG